jgi:hypothetical protein
MRTDRSEASARRGDPASGHTDRLETCWPLVRVCSVQVTATAAGERARALVQLGGLTPADVRVELFAAGAEESAPAQGGQLRMFSAQAYGNGCFVFDAGLPPGDSAGPREWTVHVHPSEGCEEPRVLYRFRSGAP